MFVAITLNVYACPVVKPETTNGDEAPVARLAPVVVQYAVYVEMTLPPVQDGAVNATETEVPLAEVAVPMVGALATSKGLYPGRTIPAGRLQDIGYPC
jgi:hypothetical protein